MATPDPTPGPIAVDDTVADNDTDSSLGDVSLFPPWSKPRYLETHREIRMACLQRLLSPALSWTTAVKTAEPTMRAKMGVRTPLPCIMMHGQED